MKAKQSRRDFIRVTAAGALGAIVLSQYGCKTGGKPAPAQTLAEFAAGGLGLQLYTIRDAMALDVPGSLKKVADLGYKYLELAGYSQSKFYGYEPVEFKKLVEDMGMIILSSHTEVEAAGITLDNAHIMAEDHAKLGVKYCVQPWVVPEARTTIASYQKMVAEWNKVGEMMKEHGIQFAYHNHNFEFDTVEGKIPFFDVFMVELDKELVTMELDLFWTTKAGQNPVDLFKRYPGRFQLFHMKDMFTNEAPFYTTDGVVDFAPVGAGVMNFKEILDAREIAGVKYLIVEQDSTKDGLPFDALKTSITNLKTKILV
jgi:sugar phosphate isomerase/epimerase